MKTVMSLLILLVISIGQALAATDYKEAYQKGEYEIAYKLAKPLVEKGDAQAQYTVAVMYVYGEGVSKNHQEAAKWMTKSAEKGYAAAQSELGWWYWNGYITPKNEKEAVKWFMKAAKQGNDSAQYFLGEMYFNGEGVKQDFAEAARLFTQAARQGHLNAQWYLGEMYRDGLGVHQNYKEAFRWLSESAQQGHPMAQADLGMMYKDGRGVLQNFVQAYMWLIIAASKDNKWAAQDKEDLAKLMTPDQISEAQQLAAEWKPINSLSTTNAGSPIQKNKRDTLFNSSTNKLSRESKVGSSKKEFYELQERCGLRAEEWSKQQSELMRYKAHYNEHLNKCVVFATLVPIRSDSVTSSYYMLYDPNANNILGQYTVRAYPDSEDHICIINGKNYGNKSQEKWNSFRRELMEESRGPE